MGWGSARTIGMLVGSAVLDGRVPRHREPRQAAADAPRHLPRAHCRRGERGRFPARRAIFGHVLPAHAVHAADPRLPRDQDRHRLPRDRGDGGGRGRLRAGARHAGRRAAGARRSAWRSSRSGSSCYTQLPVEGSYWGDLFPGFVLTGVGIGVRVRPGLDRRAGGIKPDRAGLASGLINTSQQIGGAIGTAVISSVAISSLSSSST